MGLVDFEDRIARSYHESVARGEHDEQCEYSLEESYYLCHCSKRRLVGESTLTLRRWPKTDEGLSRYRHPHRYVIYREKRDWNLGGITRGAQHQWVPMYWWTVKPLFGPRPRQTREFNTLREARQWCDEHPPPSVG